MNELMKIDPMQADDWEGVRRIYVEGIKTGNATFQQDAPSWEEWDRSHLLQCRFVACSQGKMIGWAALSPTSSRCVYAGVAEVSIYVDVREQVGAMDSTLDHGVGGANAILAASSAAAPPTWRFTTWINIETR